MLSSADKKKWMLGIFSASLLLGVYDSNIHLEASGLVQSFVYILGFAITFSVLSGIPAFLTACFFKFNKEKQKLIFIVWAISIVFLSIPILLNIQYDLPGEFALTD